MYIVPIPDESWSRLRRVSMFIVEKEDIAMSVLQKASKKKQVYGCYLTLHNDL